MSHTAAAPHFKFTDIILFGPNGCGKGTVAGRLSAFGFNCVTTSAALDYYRNLIPAEEHQNRNNGGLMKNEIVLDHHFRYVDKHFGWKSPMLHDGMGRTREQALEFYPVLRGYRGDRCKVGVLDFQGLKLKTCVKRCRSRMEVSKLTGQSVRNDDKPLVARRRFKGFHQRYKSTIEAFGTYATIFPINARLAPTQVLLQVLDALGLIGEAKRIELIEH